MLGLLFYLSFLHLSPASPALTLSTGTFSSVPLYYLPVFGKAAEPLSAPGLLERSAVSRNKLQKMEP
uniref:Uncharacterized protein n=1 Tax=Salix viminalis TaxID=40686 RepID=A0A6N2KGG3_SALVM